MTDLYFAYCQGDILLTKGEQSVTIPSGDVPPLAFQPWEHVTTLHSPLSTLHPCLCHIYRLDRPVTDREDLQMMGLRKSYDVLSPEMYKLAGKCAELVYWDQNSKYCGCCGAPMRWDTEISKRCTECGKELWPQLQTAIIVRVTKTHPQPLPCREGSVHILTPQNDMDVLQEARLSTPRPTREGQGGGSAAGESEVLLVHAHNFRGTFYGLVAGFVETGETLEECVRREVWEETHIRVKNIRYFASQPWPYPAGLMVGFTAEYESGELQLQRSELSGGGWFRKDNLPEIPGPVSLARRLLDDWLMEN